MAAALKIVELCGVLSLSRQSSLIERASVSGVGLHNNRTGGSKLEALEKVPKYYNCSDSIGFSLCGHT
jgi:hypothetical protein